MKPQDLLDRLEAGYEYDPMYGELCNERDRLAAENTKLREENERFIIKLNAEHIVRQNVESENDKLRELCKELLDLCYDAYEQKWGWDDDWALAYEQAKKLGI